MADPTFPKQPQTVSREDLFKQVWSKPIRQLAKEYGMSDKGLAKICYKMDVPCPPRGYWAKVQAGQKVISYRLPPAKTNTLFKIVIKPKPLPVEPQAQPIKVKATIPKISEQKATYVVPFRLSKPHPIVARWLEDHEALKRRAAQYSNPSYRSSLTPAEFTTTERRKHRILDTVFKALEANGAKVTESSARKFIARLGTESFEFQIREKLKKVRVAVTPEEMNWYSKGTRQELHPTGLLVFATSMYLPTGLRREWLESAESPMESFVADVVETLITAFVALAEQRRQRIEVERLRYLEALKRQEEQQRQQRDSNQWRKFVDLAAQRQEFLMAHEFLQTIKAIGTDPALLIEDRNLGDWIAWAEDHLARRDPLAHGAEGVFSVISGVTHTSYK